MDLIVAEKPSVALAIAEALGHHLRYRDRIEAGDYVITSAIGHLCDLARPEEYDERLKAWRMDDLPVLPDPWRVVPRAGDQYSARLQTICQLARRARGLINACDAGREGELIFRWIVEACGLQRMPARRLWLSSLTPPEIREALASMRPARDYDRLYAGALARARADWLVGINATRAFTLRFGSPGAGVLSLGRVQTPTLALLVARERAIRNFRPQDYWQVCATLIALDCSFLARWEDAQGGTQLHDAEKARAIAETLRRARTARVRACETRDLSSDPPQLFDLAALQQEANRQYGFSAALTLEAAQALYEARAITYPRTDSRYVTPDLAATFPRRLATLLHLSAYHDLGELALADRAMTNPHVVNATKVTDHHAILPTWEPLQDIGAGAQAAIYDLVARRFLANCLPHATDRLVRLTFEAGGERLVARGRTETDPGWRLAETAAASEEEDEEAPGPVPELCEGDTAAIAAVKVQHNHTQPPRRYTEGALLAAMEAAGRDIDDDHLRETMRKHGLGTPATRAAIIERLKAAGYVQPQKRILLPTAKGERLIDLVNRADAPLLASADLTGQWEGRIAAIERGEERAAELESDIRCFANDLVQQVRNAPPEPSHHGQQWPPCPVCGGQVIAERCELRCSRPGCTLRLSRRILQRPLTDAELAALLGDRRTGILDGFTGKNGRHFSARLTLRRDGSGIDFDFPPAPRTAHKPATLAKRRKKVSR